MPVRTRPAAPPIAVSPRCAVAGGRLDIRLPGHALDADRLPAVSIGESRARVVFARRGQIGVIAPEGESGRVKVRVEGVDLEAAVDIGAPLATGVHQVDSPVFDRQGLLYVTFSGGRGERVPVSIFRVHPDGTREAFVSGIVNPTSLAFDPNGALHVSSRFEGNVYRVDDTGRAAMVATDLGVACGLAFAPDGTMFVGDRSGTVFRVEGSGKAAVFATLPPSVAAFHLALSPEGVLHATAPSLRAYDHVYRIEADGRVETLSSGFGRPQGLAFGPDGALYVAEALAGNAGLFRVTASGLAERVVAAPSVVGVAFDGSRGFIVSSNDTVYRFGEGALA